MNEDKTVFTLEIASKEEIPGDAREDLELFLFASRFHVGKFRAVGCGVVSVVFPDEYGPMITNAGPEKVKLSICGPYGRYYFKMEHPVRIAVLNYGISLEDAAMSDWRNVGERNRDILLSKNKLYRKPIMTTPPQKEADEDKEADRHEHHYESRDCGSDENDQQGKQERTRKVA